MKIRPEADELFHVDGRMARQTDMTKLIVAVRNFANAPKTRTLTEYPNSQHAAIKIC